MNKFDRDIRELLEKAEHGTKSFKGEIALTLRAIAKIQLKILEELEELPK